MTKTFLITALAVVCIVLSACSDSKALISGSGDGGAGTVTVAKEEINLMREWKQRSDAPKNITIEYEGKSYNVKYTESQFSAYYGCDYDEYTCSAEDGNDYVFGINVESGKTIRYHRVRKTDFTLDESERKNREECLERALQCVNKYTTGEYELTYERYDTSSTEDGMYQFYFTKKINGIFTKSEVNVSVNTSGEICSFNFYSAPMLADEKVPKIDLDKADKAVEERIAEIVPEGTETSLGDKYVARLKDGKYGIVYNVHVDEESNIEMFVYIE